MRNKVNFVKNCACSITTVSVSAMEADEVQNSNGTVGEGGARGKNSPRKKI